MIIDFSKMCFFCVLILVPQQQSYAAETEVIEDVLGTLEWMDDLKHYDVEIVIRQSGESSAHVFEKVVIANEIFDGETEEFVIGIASGQQQLMTNPASQRDLAQQILSYGDARGAKREVLRSKFAVSNIVCQKSKYGCRDAARGFAIHSAILQFVLPSSNAPRMELQALLSLLTTTELIEETVVVKRDKKERKIKKVRMTAKLDDANDPTRKYAIRYLITISKDGVDAGRILSIQKGELRPGSREYRSSKDVYPFERSVSIKWEEFKNAAGEKVVLPVSVMKRFADDPNDRKRDTMTEKMTFDWRRVNEKKETENAKVKMAKRAITYSKRIESMLNR